MYSIFSLIIAPFLFHCILLRHRVTTESQLKRLVRRYRSNAKYLHVGERFSSIAVQHGENILGGRRTGERYRYDLGQVQAPGVV
jgi:hypothetical protein